MTSNNKEGYLKSTDNAFNVNVDNLYVFQSLQLLGSGAGSLAFDASAVTSAYTWKYPSTAGSAGQVLTSQGGNTMTWTTGGGGGGGSGTVTSVGMTVPTFLSVTPSSITTSGTFALSLSGTALPVLNGGTGTTTSTGSGSNVLSTTPTFTSGIILAAATSGTITFIPPATVTTYSFIPPTTSGTSGQVLTSAAGETMTWTTPATGTVTSIGMTVPTFLSVTPSSITTSGTFALSLSGTALPVLNGGTGTTTSTGSGSVVLSSSPVFSTGASNVISLTPATTNGECGILFNSQTTSGSGARWVLGQNVASSGADTFGLFSATTGSLIQVISTTQASFGVNVRAPSYILPGSSSGTITFAAPDTVTTYSFIPPATSGTSGQVLTSSGGGAMTWATAGGGGGSSFTTPIVTTISGTTSQNVIQAFVPSLTNGQQTSLQVGASASTSNAGYFLFNNLGGPGIASNFIQLGVLGATGAFLRMGSDFTRIDGVLILNGGITVNTSATFNTSPTFNQSIRSNGTLISSTRFHMYFFSGATETGRITDNGSTVTYFSASDYRIKTNVQPIQNSLSKVLQLKPCTYTFTGTQVEGEGFLAHEVQGIIPSAVSGYKDEVDQDDNPVIQAVDYSKVTPLLTAAVQELTAIVEQQQQTINQILATMNM